MRKLALLSFSFAAGIFLAQYLLPNSWLLPGAGLALAVFLSALFQKGERWLRVTLLSVGICLALVYNWGYIALVQTPAEVLAESYLENLTLEVCTFPEKTPTGARVTTLLQREGTRLVKLVYYGGDELLTLQPGDKLTGGAYVSSAAHINENDITALTAKGVFLMAYDRGGMTIARGDAPFRYLPQRVGRLAAEQLALLYSGDALAFMQAILLGQRSALSAQLSSDLTESGLLHITAVSGMHCSFLVGLLIFLLGKHRRRLVAAVSVAVLLFFLLLVGGSPSVARSVVMLVFLLLGPLFRRESDPPTALGTALALILLQNPFAAASVSLQLSFAAVAGMIFLTPRIQQGLLGAKTHGKLYQFVSSSLSVTFGCLVFTIPLSALYFNFLVLVAPLSNLLALFAASGIFLLGLFSLVVSFLWLPLGLVLAWPVKGLLWYFLTVAHWLAALPYHSVYFTNRYLKYWLVYAYALFGVCLLGKGTSKRRYLVGAILASLALMGTTALGAVGYRSGALDILALDVGQGSSTLLQSGGQSVLVDCGSSNRHISAGERAAEMLRTAGVAQLDYLALTHYHADHANGLEDLLARVAVGQLLLPDSIEDEYGLGAKVLALAEDYGIPVEYISQKSSYTLGRAQLTVFPSLGSGSTNEEGISLLCSAGDFDLLLTGDMDSATERKLIEQYVLPDTELLVVGHHGSRYSSSQEFLAAIRPEVALISVGDNSYGHPTDETLRRLLLAQAEIYRTDLQGTIHIKVN